MKNYASKMFISYSHEDELYMVELRKHLILLEKKGILNQWCDKELVAGDELQPEIMKHLEDADIIAFLVSIDFQSSDFCVRVELAKALEKKKNQGAVIIPIIVRTCRWQDSVLGQFVAATKNGNPISDYENADKAWVEVSMSIEKVVEKFNKQRIENKPEDQGKTFFLKEEFLNELNNTEIIFQHKHKEFVTLEDIYVFPDVKDLKKEYDKIELLINSEHILSFEEEQHQDKILILGTEQAGKTSLAKMMLKISLNASWLPVFVKGTEIKSSDTSDMLMKLIPEQYQKLTRDEYFNQSRKKILFVDDYHQSKLNSKYRFRFVDSVVKQFDKVILFSDSMMKFDEINYSHFSGFYQYEILPLGHERRGVLIDKWNSMGQSETIDINALYQRNDIATMHLNAILRKNVVPSKPLYVLTIIQLLDTSVPSDYTLTSYGHCYQTLIQQALQKVKVTIKDFELYINYLSELAYYIFESGKDIINEDALFAFQHEYSNKYILDSHKNVLSVLTKAGILRIGDSGNCFCYRYIYYFYVAKYIADHLQTADCKKTVEYLCKRMHTERNANILIFLTHHSKNQEILDKIYSYTTDIFKGINQAKLDSEETDYLAEFMGAIPQLVIEQRNAEEERKKKVIRKDKIERDEQGEENEADDLNESTLAEINKSYRAVDIIGQILRNRQNSLTRKQLYDLTSSAFSSGLRFLKFFLNLTTKSKDEILNVIKHLIEEDSKVSGDEMPKKHKISDEDITKKAKRIFLMISYGMSYSVIKKIANSTGSKELMPILNKIDEDNPGSPAIKLIQIAAHLEFAKTIPEKEILALDKTLEKNLIAKRLLQEIIVQYLYLHNVDYKKRQWIASKLKIPLSFQRELQHEKATKVLAK